MGIKSGYCTRQPSREGPDESCRSWRSYRTYRTLEDQYTMYTAVQKVHGDRLRILYQTAGVHPKPTSMCPQVNSVHLAMFIHCTSYMKTHSDHSGRVDPPASHYDGNSLMSASRGIAHDPCDLTDHGPAYRNNTPVSPNTVVTCFNMKYC